jgi:hypothetical protein
MVKPWETARNAECIQVNHSGLCEVIPSLANWLQPKYGIKKITGPRINKELSIGLVFIKSFEY